MLVETSHVRTDDPPKAEDTPPPAAAIHPDVAETPPSLALYREESSVNAQDLLGLSASLETKGDIQRALLAAERVMDSVQADETQIRAATGSIRRLRPQVPAWNTEAATAFQITLHAGTGKSSAAVLEPLLQELAREIEKSSAGILKVTARVTSGRDIPQDIGPPLIALWLAGPADRSHSTEIFSFTVLSPETLRDDLASTLLQLLRGHIGRTTFLRIPESEVEDTNPVARLQTHVTRLVWLELGSRLDPAE